MGDLNWSLTGAADMAEAARLALFLGVGAGACMVWLLADGRGHNGFMWFLLFGTVGGVIAAAFHAETGFLAVAITLNNSQFTFTDNPVKGISIVMFVAGLVTVTITGMLAAMVVPPSSQ